jgi:hypothetical protein
MTDMGYRDLDNAFEEVYEAVCKAIDNRPENVPDVNLLDVIVHEVFRAFAEKLEPPKKDEAA